MFLRKCCLFLLIISCSCSLFRFSSGTIPAVYAASNPIQLQSPVYHIAFPQYIDFSATALDASSTITSATIFITFNVTFNRSGEMYDSSGNPEQHTAPIAQPAQNVSLSWREQTESTSFYAPGTQVEYHWVLQDSAGNVYVEPQQQFVTADSRFSWFHLSQGTVQVNWYNQPQSFGTALLADATNDIARISHVLGGIPHALITLWVYGSGGDFHGALPPDSYEWVGGIAYPLLDEATIVAASTSDITVIRDLPHELTHIVFYQLTAQGEQVPTWFNEGLAVYNQLYHEPQMTDRFNQALSTHALLRLSSLQTRFPADSDLAELAYAQSWNLVDYMFKTFGEARMQQFIRALNTPITPFDQAMKQTFDMDSLHLENQWRLSLNQPAVLSPGQPKQPQQPKQPKLPEQPQQPKQPQKPVQPQKPQVSSTSDIGTSAAILFGSWLMLAFVILMAVVVVNNHTKPVHHSSGGK